MTNLFHSQLTKTFVSQDDELAVQAGLVRGAKLRQAVLRSAFEGRL